jgi:hypothetical protein
LYRQRRAGSKYQRIGSDPVVAAKATAPESPTCRRCRQVRTGLDLGARFFAPVGVSVYLLLFAFFRTRVGAFEKCLGFFPSVSFAGRASFRLSVVVLAAVLSRGELVSAFAKLLRNVGWCAAFRAGLLPRLLHWRFDLRFSGARGAQLVHSRLVRLLYGALRMNAA